MGTKTRRHHHDDKDAFRRSVTRTLAQLLTHQEQIMAKLADVSVKVDELVVKQSALSDAITAVLAMDGDPMATQALADKVDGLTATVVADTKRLTDRVATP